MTLSDPTPSTATDRVYDAIYTAVLERRLQPGQRLREVDLATGFEVSRTVVRQALQRLAQGQVVELQHNRGAQVVQPTRESAAHVFDTRRVIECEVARRLGGKLKPAQLAQMRRLVAREAAADARGDRSAASRLSGQVHRVLVQWSGNPVLLRMLDELLPTTTLLMALLEPGARPVCVAHRHQELVAAFEQSGTAAAAEMRRHLVEIEESLLPPRTPGRRPKNR